jgi:conjugative transfer region protein TrbK
MIDEPQKRRRPKLGRLPAGLGALLVGTLGSALVVGGIVALRDPVTPSRYAVDIRGKTVERATAGLTRELTRCRTATEATADAACHAAWETHRRHFFGPSRMSAQEER